MHICFKLKKKKIISKEAKLYLDNKAAFSSWTLGSTHKEPEGCKVWLYVQLFSTDLSKLSIICKHFLKISMEQSLEKRFSLKK